jgi:hypothetical protein
MTTRLEATWEYPQYTAYSILNAINPAICWQSPINNPLIRSFDVEVYREEEDLWVNLGQTEKNYAYVDIPSYDIKSSYLIRIATIGVSGKRSGWSYSSRYIASPLRFDFSVADTVRLPNGESKPNQRLFFLMF